MQRRVRPGSAVVLAVDDCGRVVHCVVGRVSRSLQIRADCVRFWDDCVVVSDELAAGDSFDSSIRVFGGDVFDWIQEAEGAVVIRKKDVASF